MVRVLIVGAGTTGALCAHMVRRHLPTKLQCQIIVWEKSRGVGGRMSLSKYPEVKEYTAELGAQYITQNSKYLDVHKEFYDELRNSDVLKPLKGNIEGFHGDESANFISKDGLSSVAKYFFAKALTDIYTNVKLDSLRLTSDNPSREWSVWKAATSEGRHDHFDAVILTMPVPQILGIEGVKDCLSESQIDDLTSVKYSSRFAMSLFYKPESFDMDFPFVARYLPDNEIVRYFAFDSVKRGLEGDFASLVVHTSVPFGKKHLEEDKDTIGPMILEELHRIVPDLPEPRYVKYHKWRYSQVTNATVKYGCMVVRTKPLMILAGDGFTHSNFDGCVQSAIKVGEEIEKWVVTA